MCSYCIPSLATSAFLRVREVDGKGIKADASSNLPGDVSIAARLSGTKGPTRGQVEGIEEWRSGL
jgi:hypothetical protein